MPKKPNDTMLCMTLQFVSYIMQARQYPYRYSHVTYLLAKHVTSF